MLGEILSDIVGEAVTNAIGRFFLTGIGFVYLYGRYWQPQRVQAVLAEQYASRYVNAGRAVMNSLMQIIGVLLLLTLWIGVAVLSWLHR